eukprot:TRINITY_DN7144_c0_g2_i2.p1 TRINITY_DN7144_c0_g2~~TRINITY_DN7144_c0_g2_i2.p1  ORF type:complete len:692 (+),score=75.63 TRINITY_DN7144_c0_g2_i2:58-2076(+)
MVEEVIGKVDSDVRIGENRQFAPIRTCTPGEATMRRQFVSSQIEDSCSLAGLSKTWDVDKKHVSTQTHFLNVTSSPALSSNKGHLSVVREGVANAGQSPHEAWLSRLAHTAGLPSAKDLQRNSSSVAADVNLLSQVDSIQTQVGDIKAMVSVLYTKHVQDKSDEGDAASSLFNTLLKSEALIRDIFTDLKEDGKRGIHQESVQVLMSDSESEPSSQRTGPCKFAESPFVGLVRAAAGIDPSHAANSSLLRRSSQTSQQQEQPEETNTNIELAMISIVCLDLVWMVVSLHFEYQEMASNVPQEEAVSYRFRWIDGCFIALYAAEIVARLLWEGCLFYTGQNALFHLLDVLILAVRICYFFSFGFTAPFLKVFRVVRVAYVPLLFRRFSFRYLWMLTACNVSSAKVIFQLGWVAVPFLLITAQVLKGGIQEMFLRDDLDEQTRAALYENFGSLGMAMMTLFKCVSGGSDWSVLLDLFKPISRIYSLILTMFVIVMRFGVRNVLTALIISQTQKVLGVHARKMNQAMMIYKDSSLHLLRGIFMEVSARNQLDRSADTSRITKEVVDAVLELPEVHGYLRELGITSDLLVGVFDLLDIDISCEVCIDEFLNFLVVFASSPDRVGQALGLFHHKQILWRLQSCSRQVGDITHVVLKELRMNQGSVLQKKSRRRPKAS